MSAVPVPAIDREPSTSSPWLFVIGIGDGGLASLTGEQRQALDAAEVVFGGNRHLKMLQGYAGESLRWRSPFKDSLADIEARRGRRVVILASGDPLWFGVAGTLAATYGPDEMHILPGPSAFQLAAARLGWVVEETTCVSAHGLPVEGIHRFVQPEARLLVLSSDGATPQKISALLVARGYGASRLTILEHLGGPLERRMGAKAETFEASGIAALNIVAVECVACAETLLLPAVPGLPDEAFVHDGKMTKRVLRALAIAALGPTPGTLLLDIGAGSGSISVEWMRAARGALAVAVEPVAERRAMIEANALALGTPGLSILAGKAPDAIEGMGQRPDAIFIGGGLSDGVFDAAWAVLKPGGRMVAHAVTLESEAILLALHARLGGELMRVEVQRAEPVGPFRGWRPAMPVVHWHLTKPAENLA